MLLKNKQKTHEHVQFNMNVQSGWKLQALRLTTVALRGQGDGEKEDEDDLHDRGQTIQMHELKIKTQFGFYTISDK